MIGRSKARPLSGPTISASASASTVCSCRNFLATIASLLLLALGLLLEGCSSESEASKICSLDIVYRQLVVDGQRNFTREELDKAHVKLCARHTDIAETYEGESACSSPEKVFPDGILPDVMSGDSQALLLVVCPTPSYPGGKDMQRVVCLRNETGGYEIRFDEYSRSANCVSTPGMLGYIINDVPSAKATTGLPSETHNEDITESSGSSAGDSDDASTTSDSSSGSSYVLGSGGKAPRPVGSIGPHFPGTRSVPPSTLPVADVVNAATATLGIDGKNHPFRTSSGRSQMPLIRTEALGKAAVA